MPSKVYSIRIPNTTLWAILQDLDSQGIAYSSVSGAVNSFLEISILSEKIQDSEEAKNLIAQRIEMGGKSYGERQGSRPKQRFAAQTTQEQRSNLANIFQGSTASLDTDFAPSLNSNFEFNLVDSVQEQKGYGLEEVLSTGEVILKEVENRLDLEAGEQDELESLVMQSIAELEKEQSEELLSKLTGGFSVQKAENLPKPKPVYKAISERDPRLEKDRFWKAFSGEKNETKMFALRVLYYNLPEEWWSSEKAEKMLVSLLESLSN